MTGMELGAAGAAINATMGIAKGILGKVAHNKYAKKLSGLEMKMPNAIFQAEGIKSDLAYGDMPGFDTMMGDVDAGTASTMTEAKKVATSPAALMDALTKSFSGGQEMKRGLSVDNAMFQANNQDSLANFFSTVKAPAEQRIEQFGIDKQIAMAKEKMQGTKELLSGVEGGIGSAFSAFGQGKQLGFMEDRNEMMKQYWNTGGGGSGTNPGSFMPFSPQNMVVPNVYDQMSGGFGGMGNGGGGFRIPE